MLTALGGGVSDASSKRCAVFWLQLSASSHQHNGDDQQRTSSKQLQDAAEREAVQHQLEQARQEASAATYAARAAESEVAALRLELDQVHASYQAAAQARGPPQMEQQVQELRELLYQKQAQLERLAADRAAQQLMLERQVMLDARVATTWR